MRVKAQKLEVDKHIGGDSQLRYSFLDEQVVSKIALCRASKIAFALFINSCHRHFPASFNCRNAQTRFQRRSQTTQSSIISEASNQPRFLSTLPVGWGSGCGTAAFLALTPMPASFPTNPLFFAFVAATVAPPAEPAAEAIAARLLFVTTVVAVLVLVALEAPLSLPADSSTVTFTWAVAVVGAARLVRVGAAAAVVPCRLAARELTALGFGFSATLANDAAVDCAMYGAAFKGDVGRAMLDFVGEKDAL